MRALRAVRAVFRAATSLDGDQLAGLHAIRSVVCPVNGLRPEHQFRQRGTIDSLNLGAFPMVPQIPSGGGVLRRFQNHSGCHGPPSSRAESFKNESRILPSRWQKRVSWGAEKYVAAPCSI